MKVVVRLNAESFEHLVEHLAVLAGDADNGFYARTGAKLVYERAHFDGFGTRAENEHYFFQIVKHSLHLGVLNAAT
jgi:hypothetical protein